MSAHSESKSQSLGSTKDAWRNAHVLSVDQFDNEALELVMDTTDEMKALVQNQGGDERLKRKIIACVFFEPSTRTNCSFQASIQRLGGSVIAVNESTSSAKKGESLHDTIRCMDCYCDAIVLRHPVQNSCFVAAEVSRKPIINAGDGIGEHPTQALLDLYTIRSELGRIRGLTITMVGDLKNGRTVHSLAKLLAKVGDVDLHYVSPESLKMPSYIKEYVNQFGIRQTEHSNLTEILSQSDVLYCTRIQKERFASEEEYESVKGCFILTNELLQQAKQQMIVMHPLPRVDEISTECDGDHRAAYFRQMENGMYVRMALLSLILQ